MSRKEQITKFRNNSDHFLQLLAVQVSVLGQENWQSLPDDTHNDEVLPFLTGLTHKDYLDGPNLWSAISDEETLLQFIVMTEGFKGGVSKVRDIIAKMMGETLTVSRHNTSIDEIKEIQRKRDQDSVVAIYLTGNRNLQSPLKPGIQLMMREEDVMYPFINLSDTKPAFPSGSSIKQNLGELLQRTLLNRTRSNEYLYLMKPITNQALEEMKESKKGKLGRKEVMTKLEVLRAYGVFKTLMAVAGIDPLLTNPLFANSDNFPLLKKSQQVLSDNLDQVAWLADQGYFNLAEIKLFLTIQLDDEK
jgi:hypothetical protein